MSDLKTKNIRIQVIIFATFLVFTSCGSDNSVAPVSPDSKFDYKQKMRDFVIGISKYSKAINPNFAVIPQNGIELVSYTGTSSGRPYPEYLNAIDANGQEGLFYGYETYDQATNPTK